MSLRTTKTGVLPPRRLDANCLAAVSRSECCSFFTRTVTTCPRRSYPDEKTRSFSCCGCSGGFLLFDVWSCCFCCFGSTLDVSEEDEVSLTVLFVSTLRVLFSEEEEDDEEEDLISFFPLLVSLSVIDFSTAFKDRSHK